jgi:hypothetical protein
MSKEIPNNEVSKRWQEAAIYRKGLGIAMLGTTVFLLARKFGLWENLGENLQKEINPSFKALFGDNLQAPFITPEEVKNNKHRRKIEMLWDTYIKEVEEIFVLKFNQNFKLYPWNFRWKDVGSNKEKWQVIPWNERWSALLDSRAFEMTGPEWVELLVATTITPSEPSYTFVVGNEQKDSKLKWLVNRFTFLSYKEGEPSKMTDSLERTAAEILAKGILFGNDFVLSKPADFLVDCFPEKSMAELFKLHLQSKPWELVKVKKPGENESVYFKKL